MSSSSRAKNFRRKTSSTDDVNVEDASTKTPNPTSQAKRELPKRLSFADDVDDDNNESPSSSLPRKPSRSAPPSSLHRLSSSRDRVKGSSLAPPPLSSNVQPQTGEYTKEKLLQLQKNARPLGSMHRAQANEEPVIVLRGTLKPPDSSNYDMIKEGKEEEKEEKDSDNDDDEKNDGRILDQAMIQAIRAKRQQRQQLRYPAPDYISLDDGMPSIKTSVGSSDEEENDFNQRIALFGSKAKQKKGVFEGMEKINIDNGMDDDEDEEERKWEEEQFRKGLGRRIDETKGNNSIQTISSGQQPTNHLVGVSKQTPSSTVAVGANLVGVTRSAMAMSIPQQAEVATRALQESINKLKENHSLTLNCLIKTETNISDSLSEITNLENSLKDADEKYIFMQELRDFVSVMCEFLNDKAFYIEELEEQMQKLHEKRALAVIERRAEDIADEANEVEVAVNAAMAVLSKGSGSTYESAAIAAAQTAIAASKEGTNLPIELDEFGRDANLRKRMDIKRRSEARKRRKIQAESKRLTSIGKDIMSEQVEGELSTDESDDESTAYFSSRSELLQTAQEIFSDASDEYSSLASVKKRFEIWKKRYSSSYRDAYVSLSVPSIFSTYVRVELLKWDPLYEKTEFFDMEWHNLLFNYGLVDNQSDSEFDNVDANLVPNLVEKVALPILHHEIEHCWDVLSTNSTRNAVFAANMVILYVPSSSKALHELLTIVHNRLNDAVSSLTVPMWNTSVTNVVPGAAQVASYRFGMSVRLLRNICLWKNILSLPVLEKLALEELMKGKILPHVKNVVSNIHDAITKTERIVSSLSGAWSGPDVTSEPSQKLRPLVDFVTNLAIKLEKRYTNEEESHQLARRLKNMLVALNEYDKARSLLRTFHLKEAL